MIKRQTSPNATTASTSPLHGSDFLVPTRPKRQANILIFGDSGTGKTSFTTRFAPDPIALLSYDRRASHALYEALQAGKNIYSSQLDFPSSKLPADEAKRRAEEIVDKTVRNIEIAVAESLKGNVRTICLDTGTEYSEILKLSFDGVIHQTKAGAYGKDKDYINRQWWRLFNLARDGQAHFVVTARAKEIWVNQEPTGRFTYRCPSVINDAVDWSGHIRLKKGRPGRLKKEFELEITKAGANIAELGEVYTEEDWGELGGPFTYACYMQYINVSELEDWQ